MKHETRIAFQSLGCKVNQYEADKAAAQFATAGYRIVPYGGEADVAVVNTCTVTSEADRKSRQIIRRMARKNPSALVVVTGCHAAAWADELEGVHTLKVSQLEKETLFTKVHEALFNVTPTMPETVDYHTTPAFHTRTRAYLKVQDGCDRFCTYCIIPYVRGRSRSRPPDEILKEATQLLMEGYQEIVVTGICVGDYGRDIHGQSTFSSLFEQILKLPYDARFRLSSFDPCDMDQKLFDLLTEHPKACRHLHLALQHGSDKILRRMGRDYTCQEFFILCRELSKKATDFAITTDILVGFPGETEDDFEETVQLSKSIGFSKIHVFPYSERKGTGAVKHPNKVPVEIRNERVQKLLSLSSELTESFNRKFLGTIQDVLVEHERDKKTGLLQGYTSNYIPVFFEGPDFLQGKRVPVQLKEVVVEKVKGVGLNKPEIEESRNGNCGGNLGPTDDNRGTVGQMSGMPGSHLR